MSESEVFIWRKRNAKVGVKALQRGGQQSVDSMRRVSTKLRFFGLLLRWLLLRQLLAPRLTIPPGISPAALLDSPIMLPNTQVSFLSLLLLLLLFFNSSFYLFFHSASSLLFIIFKCSLVINLWGLV